MANNSSQKSNQLRRPSPEGSVYLPDAEGDRITSESQVSYKETRYPQECADSDLWKKMGEMQDITKLNSLFEAHRYQADVKAHIKVKKRINLQLREEKLKETKWSNEYEQQRYRRLNDYKEKGLRSLSAGGLSDTDLSHAEKTTRLVVQKTSLRPSRFTQSHKNILRPTHLPPVSKAAKINITVSKSTGGGSGPTFRKSNSCSANTRHKESQLSACNRSAPPVYLPPRSSKLASNLNVIFHQLNTVTSKAN